MLSDTRSFSPRRSGGVRHPPEADIESIRDLLRGDGSSRSILKELTQNAEDAEASQMDVLYLPGDPASPLSLLRGSSLLVANDGIFKEEHRDAITQINLGTKGTEDRAIGRFGKGLKSVFAWCEAFFIIAQTDPAQGWPEASITDFFNPWHGQAGSETWECISAEEPVLPIPNTSNPSEILARIPALAPISREHTLVARGANGSLPGLYDDDNDVSPWPEDLVLRLLKDVRLGSTGSETTAAWLNEFLNHLHEHNTLTYAIYNLASDLPLLSARDARTNARVRLSAREWRAYVDADRLFVSGNQKDRWLALLCATLPEWSCFVALDWALPRWFKGSYPPDCDAARAAKIVVNQTSLGSINHRRKLIEAFASLARRDHEMCLAMRFLMHGKGPHARDGVKLLFMPSTQPGQQIWSRLIEQLLLAGGVAPCANHDRQQKIASIREKFASSYRLKRRVKELTFRIVVRV